MRTLLLCGAVVAAALVFPREGSAYDGPWCVVINLGSNGPQERCSMPSFEACREEAMHFGSSSFCRQNGRWPGYWASGPRAKSHTDRHKRRHHG